MSELPKYQRIPDEEQSYGHTKLDAGPDDDEADADGSHASDANAPLYPPAASGSWQGASRRKRVELCLVPRWPLKCERAIALASLGATREEMVDNAREAFVSLCEFPPDRVEFLLKLSSGQRQRVMPSVWDTIVNDPPDQLGVLIADGPGDEEERERRTRRAQMIFLLAMLIGFGTFGVGLFFAAREDRKKIEH